MLFGKEVGFGGHLQQTQNSWQTIKAAKLIKTDKAPRKYCI